MKLKNTRFGITIILNACFAATALGAPSLPPLVVAIRHADCEGAIKLVNTDSAKNDDQTVFVAGRMLDEGLCVKQDSAGATAYFARAAELGNRRAKIDYAAKMGLGEGTPQSYELAGAACRGAGFDPDSKLTHYSLGYACTLAGVAGKIMRESLPMGAFLPDSGAAVIEFNPTASEIQIRSTPHVGHSERATGSNLSLPKVDAEREFKKAWAQALATAPKPDPARLENQTVQLEIDVDMMLEVKRDVVQRQMLNAPLYQGDIRHMGTPN
jgi:hypothetical protein